MVERAHIAVGAVGVAIAVSPGGGLGTLYNRNESDPHCAIGTGRFPDEWLADVTLFGPPAHIRDQVEAWFDAGVRTPILVPSSAAGNQIKALEELFATFDN